MKLEFKDRMWIANEWVPRKDDENKNFGDNKSTNELHKDTDYGTN